MFEGDVCPGCNEAYPPITHPTVIPDFGEKRGGGVPPGSKRRETCLDCADPLPKVRSPIQRCRDCQAERDRTRHMLNKRDRRAVGLER